MESISKVFSVQIRNKYYDVYNIPGKEHAGLNDSIKTWWLYYDDRLPDGIAPDLDNDKLIPYPERSIKRVCWDIRIKSINSHKIKWDDHDFSHRTSCEMWANGKLIYSFETRDSEFAMINAQYLQAILIEHPFRFFEYEKNNGRQIYYYGLPATIIVNNTFPWEIHIKPDYCYMTKEVWWEEYKRRQNPCSKDFAHLSKEHIEEYMQNDLINHGDALSDGRIGWYRNGDDVSIV